MTSTLWFALAAGNVIAALFAREMKKSLPRWKDDRAMDWIGGCLIGWALVSTAMGIAEVVS